MWEWLTGYQTIILPNVLVLMTVALFMVSFSVSAAKGIVEIVKSVREIESGDRG